MLGTVQPSDMSNNVVYHIGNHLVTESSKLTPALVGERFAEAMREGPHFCLQGAYYTLLSNTVTAIRGTMIVRPVCMLCSC